ncbi:MAG: creatininase family protein [Leptolyngbyaceae cyanobacterium]
MLHGWIPADRYFPYLTWTEIEAMPDKENIVIIQPIGAIEQHGPHLPLVVDSAIATAVAGKALQQLEPEIAAYALPTLCYGKSNEHVHFPGTITLSAETLLALLMEVGTSLYRAGFRKWVLVNAHGGQPQVLEIAARDLHQHHEDLMVFPLFVWRAPHLPLELLTDQERQFGIHGGDAETSVILSLLPEQTNMNQAKCSYPQDLPTNSLLSMEGAFPFSWATRDLSQNGVLGDPTSASAAKGDQFLDALVSDWVQVFRDVYRFKPPQVWKH